LYRTKPSEQGGKGRGRDDSRTRSLIGTDIKIICGPYKGNIGNIKNIMETTALVVLYSTGQTILIDQSHITNIETELLTKTKQNSGCSSYNRTPSNSGGQTPMYGPKTPMYNGK
jgi:transcription elongation factor SPT5